MPDIEFACPHCQQVLEAPDDMAGETVDCPNCQSPIVVPGTEPAPAADPAPAKKAPAPAAGGAECPECGAAMPAGSVLCLQCGFHQKLGKKISTEFT